MERKQTLTHDLEARWARTERLIEDAYSKFRKVIRERGKIKEKTIQTRAKLRLLQIGDLLSRGLITERMANR
ncbi:MAG: hypothetical protein Q7S92_06680 [Candidatus Diapherotrites archaeon]|nr:hypothetical protein [Candidatus Diapherotrites archaeon]